MVDNVNEEIRVPSAIWEHKQLKMDDKCLWIFIFTRRDETAFCTLTNQEIAKSFGWTVNYLNRRLKTLKNQNCLKTVWFNGRVRQMEAMIPNLKLEPHE